MQRSTSRQHVSQPVMEPSQSGRTGLQRGEKTLLEVAAAVLVDNLRDGDGQIGNQDFDALPYLERLKCLHDAVTAWLIPETVDNIDVDLISAELVSEALFQWIQEEVMAEIAVEESCIDECDEGRSGMPSIRDIVRAAFEDAGGQLWTWDEQRQAYKRAIEALSLRSAQALIDAMTKCNLPPVEQPCSDQAKPGEFSEETMLLRKLLLLTSMER